MSRFHSTLILLATVASTAAAQEPAPIQDNSFLVEEAYNQERGVVQHISTFARDAQSGNWAYGFTQEWPMLSQRHQLSYTLAWQHLAADAGSPSTSGMGDILLNYRYQALGVGGGRVAFAPRLSVVVPVGDEQRGLGTGGTGLQVNAPLSVAVGSHLVTHWNAGATRIFNAANGSESVSLTSWNAAQSVVWLAHPLFNVLVETAWTRSETPAGGDATAHVESLVVSPGVRAAFNTRSGMQIVPGLAVPIGVGASRGDRMLFAYLSVEHAF